MAEVGELMQTAMALADTKRQIKQLELLEESLELALKDGLREGVIDEETIKGLGLNPTRRSGGFDEGMLALLKLRGLRDAIVTQEKVDQKRAKELLASGVLTEAEVEPYKKPDSLYFTLPREKKS